MSIEIDLKVIIALPFIFFISGYLIFNHLKLEKMHLRFSEIIFVQLLVSIILTSLIGFSLAIIGLFSLKNLILILFIICIILVYINRARNITYFPKPKINYEAIALIFVILSSVGLAMIFPSAEWIIGTYDGGIYVNSGINIANTGSIVIHDQLISEINKENILITNTYNAFELKDEKNGVIIPSLHHMFPVWIAIFYLIFGIWGALHVSSLFGIMGIFSVFIVARYLTDWKVATIASTLLTYNFIQIFFSIVPYTEIMCQFFVFGGLFTFILYKKFNDRTLAIFSALSFVINMFIRIDSYILIMPFFIYFTILKATNRLKTSDIVFVETFLVATTFSIISSLLFSLHYSSHFSSRILNYIGIMGLLSEYFSFSPHEMAQILYYLLILINVIFLAWIKFKGFKTEFSSKNRDYLEKIHKLTGEIYYKICDKNIYFKDILSFSIFIFVIYIWIIRPYDANVISDAYNLIKLSWFLNIFVLIAGVLGLVALINDKNGNEITYFISIFILFAVIFIIDAQHSPYLPWMMRRYIVFTIPAMMIFAGYFIVKITEFTTQNLFLKKLTIVLIVSLIISNYMEDNSVLAQQKMLEDMVDNTKQMSDFIGDDIIIIGDEGGGISSAGRMFSTPLRYLYDKKVIFIDNNGKDNITDILIMLHSTSTELHDEDTKIYVVGFDVNNISNRHPNIQFSEVNSYIIPIKLIAARTDGMPNKITDEFFRKVTIYETQVLP